jgi:hypothetical protein
MRSLDCPVGTDYTRGLQAEDLLFHSVKTGSEASTLSRGYKNLLPLE